MEGTNSNSNTSRTNENIIEAEAKIQKDYLKEYESIDEAFPDDNPE